MNRSNIAWYFGISICGILMGRVLNKCICRIAREESNSLGPLEEQTLDAASMCSIKSAKQSLFTEILNSVLYVLIYQVYGSSFIGIIYCLMVSALIVLSVTDFYTHTIYLPINLFIYILGVITVWVEYFHSRNLRDIFNHMLGGLIVSCFLLAIVLVTRERAMGMGDVNLMAASGLLLGWKLILVSFLSGCVIAAFLHPIKMKLKWNTNVLAFGPYLSIGILIAILFGNPLVDWYIRFFGR